MSVRSTVTSLKDFFKNNDFRHTKLANRFEVTLLGYPNLKTAASDAVKILKEASDTLYERYRMTLLSF